MMRSRVLAGIVLALATASSHAAFFGRAPLTPGGTDYRAYYDDVQNVTWVADANLAKTSGYVHNDGQLTWQSAQQWIASLNSQNGGYGYLNTSDWRLPRTTDTGAPGCQRAFVGTDCGLNSLTGEMGRLFYAVPPAGLGNVGAFDTSGARVNCGLEFPPCLVNSGPFVNIQTLHAYWSSESQPGFTAWVFLFETGEQVLANTAGTFASYPYAWAVRTGDLPVLPDSDGDGAPNATDNCILIANPTQLDADSDGYGNICDADINNSGTVTAADFNLLRGVLNEACPTPGNTTACKADMNGSGTVTAADFNLMRARLNTAPGPSGLHPPP